MNNQEQKPEQPVTSQEQKFTSPAGGTKKAKPKWLVPAIIIAGIIVLGLIGWEVYNYFLKSNVPEGQPKQGQPTGKEQEDETANWKSYRNEEYGFEIKYPSTFQIDFSNSDNVYIGTDMVHRGSNGVFITILDESIDSYIDKIMSEIESDKEIGLQRDLLEDKEMYIGNIKARKIVEPIPIGYDVLYYFFEEDGINYKLEGVNGAEYHNQILSTFKFIE